MPVRHWTILFRCGISRLLAQLGSVILLCLCVTHSGPSGAAAPAPAPVIILNLDGVVGPATADYVRKGLRTAAARKAPLVILRMDTPGGLDTSMRLIIRAILASPVPVASYVSPSGARAASAGTFILYASHVAAMAPGTNMGAATPVHIGGIAPAGDNDQKNNPPNPMETKTVNDAAAFIRSLAELRGRNASWAEKAVREAASLPASTALSTHVIDMEARDVADLLRKLYGRIVKVSAGAVKIDVAGHRLGTMEIESALVAHPKVAEAAVVGKQHEIKGESVFAFVVLRGERPSGDKIDAFTKTLRDWVSEQLGAIARPDDIRFADNLPKTRSGKIMRRLLRAIARNDDITQDLSTLENPAIIDQLRGAESPKAAKAHPAKKTAPKKKSAAKKKPAAKRKPTVKKKPTAKRKAALAKKAAPRKKSKGKSRAATRRKK